MVLYVMIHRVADCALYDDISISLVPAHRPMKNITIFMTLHSRITSNNYNRNTKH